MTTFAIRMVMTQETGVRTPYYIYDRYIGISREKGSILHIGV